jgi:hypothetical protein
MKYQKKLPYLCAKLKFGEKSIFSKKYLFFVKVLLVVNIKKYEHKL